MKKILKKALAALLVVVMLLSAASVSAFAVEDAQEGTPGESNTSVNVDNDFSRIVMSKVESEEDNNPYGVTEIKIANKQATVHAVAPDGSKIIVAVYSEDKKCSATALPMLILSRRIIPYRSAA